MGARWIKLAVLYLIIGIGFGLFMHYAFDLRWGATHAHINVVGWLTTGLIGVIYSVFPRAGNSGLGVLQFWTYNIGLPVLLFGMGYIQIDPGLLMEITVSGGGILVAISVLLFIANVFTNISSDDRV